MKCFRILRGSAQAALSRSRTRPKLSVSLGPIPVSIDFLEGEYGHKTTYQTDKTATMQGIKKFGGKMLWVLHEAEGEGIPWQIPSLVVLITHKPGKPFAFSLKFNISASIGSSRLPFLKKLQRSVEPLLLNDTMQRVPYHNEIDPDFTSLDLQRLTRTSFTEDV